MNKNTESTKQQSVTTLQRFDLAKRIINLLDHWDNKKLNSNQIKEIKNKGLYSHYYIQKRGIEIIGWKSMKVNGGKILSPKARIFNISL